MYMREEDRDRERERKRKRGGGHVDNIGGDVDHIYIWTHIHKCR